MQKIYSIECVKKIKIKDLYVNERRTLTVIHYKMCKEALKLSISNNSAGTIMFGFSVFNVSRRVFSCFCTELVILTSLLSSDTKIAGHQNLTNSTNI